MSDHGGIGAPDIDRYTDLAIDSDPLPAIVARYLLPHERQVIATRRHPIVLLAPAAAFTAALLAAIALNSWAYETYTASSALVHLIWFAALAACGWSAWKWLEWRRTWFVVTASRLMLITGIVRRKTTPLPISRLTDLRLHEEAIGRRYGWGTLICESFATDHALHTVTYLPFVVDLFNEIWALKTPNTDKLGPKVSDDDGLE